MVVHATAAFLSIGLAALATGIVSGPDELRVSPAMTQFGVGIGQMVMMVMAALAVTTEYRFGTIRTSFLAVPQRMSLLLSKTVVVTVLAGVVGLIAAFGSWLVGYALAGSADMAIDTSAEWRLLYGQGLIYAIAAMVAVAVGILIRQSAGAITILILWPLLVESLVTLIPRVGDDLQKWAPFTNATHFINSGQDMGLAGRGCRRTQHGSVALDGVALLRGVGCRSARDRADRGQQARRLRGNEVRPG